MAEIHLLPESLSPVGAGRAATALARALEAGHDLGARGYHIRALGHALMVAQQQLRQLLDDIKGKYKFIEVKHRDEFMELEAFLTSVERIYWIATSYPEDKSNL